MHSIAKSEPTELTAAPIALITHGDDVALRVTIRGQDYLAAFLPPTPDGEMTIRLAKQTPRGETYDVSLTPDGLIVCDCASYEYVHRGTASRCKHGDFLFRAGFFSAYSPAADPDLHPAPDPAPMRTRVRISLAALPPLAPPDSQAATAARWAGIASMQPFGDPDELTHSADVLREQERLADLECIAAFEAWAAGQDRLAVGVEGDGHGRARADAMGAMEAEELAEMDGEQERERELEMDRDRERVERDERGSGKWFQDEDWPEAETIAVYGHRAYGGEQEGW